MASSRRKGSARAAAAAAAAARQQWKIGDLVLAKMKGFPAWPAMVSEPEKWGFSSDRKKLLVYFYGTKQIAFCNHADIEAFTEEKKKSLLIKRQGKGADFVRAVEEIIDIFDSLKIQNLESSVGGHDGNTSNQEHLEDSGIVSLGKTVKLSSSPNHHLEVASIAECGDKLRMDVSPKSLIDGVNHNRNAVVDDSAKTISILDQLRQIPLSSTPTTRKRARDALLPSSVTKSSSSLRRSRSSLVNNFTKSQKSSMQADAKHIIDCSARIITLEEPTSQAVDRGEHLSNGSAEVSPVLTQGLLEDIRAVRIDGTNSCNGSAPEASKKFEFRDNGTVSNTVPVGDVRLNSDVETSLNGEAANTMRKPFGKQVDNARACDEKDREMDMPVDGRSLSDSNSRNDTTDKFSNANGDEHLPLVKRARIRMGNPLVEEENLNDSAGSDEKSGNLVISNGHYENTTLSSPSNNCQLQNVPLKRISPVARKFARSSANSSSHTNFESDLQSCKMNKHHMMLDVEAALPPSKRLHRALEAMSANAAEAETDCPQAPCEIVIKSTECLGSSTEIINSIDESVSFPVTPLPLKASNTVAFGNNTCDLSSSSTVQNLVACCLGSSEVNPVHTNPGKETNIHMNASVEIVTDEDNDRFLIKQRTTHAEGVKILPKATGTRNSQQFVFSPSSGAAAAMSTTTTDCTTSEIDCTAACSDIINVDSSLNDMNEVPSVSSVANFCSLVSDSSGAAAALVTTKSSSTVNGISMASVSRLQFEQTSLIRDMQNVAPELKHKYKDRTILSMLAPIKDLIAAAQAKRFISRSTSICDSAIDGKVALDVSVSPTIINKEGSSVRGSPSNPMFYHRPASDDDASYLRNSSKTPLDGSYRRGVSKYASHSDAIAARRCFESLLCTLSRTKDSIGRATRLAIDCAKYGIAGEVIDILLQYLETESNLHRRIDLFFLVDSITQCSRCQKGGPGDVYPSLVQAALPRLLAAAAPPGNGALENRRQCLKVLRLWLERRTLPELSLRHHIRELEYGSEASLSISYSRRPPRMERPLNDPVREMEGMLVDEYGSNASFQLPQFLDTRILEGDEGSASDDKSFEAVTPDRNAEINSEKGITLKSSEKHRLILEDVDGELEMEDVSPPCGPEAGLSTCHFKGVEIPSNCNHKCEKNNILSFAPPLPEERPPSPPPLPSSPPPPSSNAIGKAPDPSVGLTAVADSADFSASYAAPNQLLRPISQQQRNSLHCSPPLSDMPSYYSQGYAGHSQPIPQLISSCTSSGSYSNQGGSQPVVPVGSNSQSIVNKVYHLQPPPPVVSNQFSYIQAQPSHRMQASNNQSSYSGRFHQVHDNQRGTFYGDGDQSAFHPSVHHSEALVHNADGGERPHAPSFYGAHSDISSAHCQDWPYPPRTSNYPAPASRSSLEDPTISGVSAAYWRSR